MVGKYVKVVTHREEFPSIGVRSVHEYKHMSTIAIIMITKLIRVVTYWKELPPIHLYGPSMRWL